MVMMFYLPWKVLGIHPRIQGDLALHLYILVSRMCTIEILVNRSYKTSTPSADEDISVSKHTASFYATINIHNSLKSKVSAWLFVHV